MCQAWLEVLPVDQSIFKGIHEEVIAPQTFQSSCYGLNCVFPTPNPHIEAFTPSVVVFGMGPLGGN